ncbi:MAG: OprO/OprP family phosphate-selective porin, partial [Muribaculaceae bacterium]|nr:OprO/OprP family phosphate-selective porin [Muribaculaceae bacterium]
MISKPIITALIFTAAATASNAAAENVVTTQQANAASSAETEAKIDYTPKIHGVVRTRWEGEFDNSFMQRFQVRNARLSVEGRVLPALSYYIRIDACDRGKFKILDAWAQWGFLRQWHVQAGQFRVPFGVDCFRGPGGYYFANRSFLGKQILNMRAVGAQVAYHCTALPLSVEAGIFNSSAMGNHDVWERADGMTYAAKATYRLHNVALSAGYVSTSPDEVRINIVDGAVTWQSGRWIAEGEYQNKHYTNGCHKSVNAWNVFASHAIPLKHATFNQLSFQARFDGMTDHS